LARALVRSPDVLILDESTSALDQATRELVVRNVLELFKHKMIIFVTHDAWVAEQVDEVFEVKAPSQAEA
jgi:ABC-type bacteriocin/lantibiotic exporter with double-glycine peptidase domain